MLETENADSKSLVFQHYTELMDIKRVIVNTHAIEPQVSMRNMCRESFCLKMWWLMLWCWMQQLVEFFGTLSKEWALDCMKELLLVNMRGNLQIIVQVGGPTLWTLHGQSSNSSGERLSVHHVV